MDSSLQTKHLIIFYLAIFFVLILNVLLSCSAYCQTQTTLFLTEVEGLPANATPLEIKEGWQYRWGDSPFDNQDVPVWTYKDLVSPEWKPISYSGHVTDPPNRNGRENLWLRVKLPKGTLVSG